MRFIDAATVANNLDIAELIKALEGAFAAGQKAPPRHHHTIPLSVGRKNHTSHDEAAIPQGNDKTLLIMPAWNDKIIGTKLVSVFPDNGAINLPAIHGLYILMDGTNGVPLAVLDASELTRWRTAAASALAGRYLAPTCPETMLMVGTGALSIPLIKAHMSQHESLKSIHIWGRSSDKAAAIVDQLRNKGIRANICDNLSDGAQNAHIISTATLSSEPLIKGQWLSNNCHLDLVGAYKPTMRESDDEAITKAQLFVDTFEGGLSEGGDIVQPMRDGLISKADIKADLYDLCQKRHLGRTSDDEITLFKSVGASLEDLVAASLVMQKITANDL